MIRRALTAVPLLALAVTGCAGTVAEQTTVTPAATSAAAPASQSVDEAIAALGMQNLSAREIIDALDAMPLDQRPQGFRASIRPDELILSTSETSTRSLEMPDDALYLSFAPYISSTHDCHFHSLTTCTGEQRNTQVKVSVVDKTTGQTVLEETRTSFDNGFVGLWLPRGLDATLEVEVDGRTASQDISTDSNDDATCLTTLHLA